MCSYGYTTLTNNGNKPIRSCGNSAGSKKALGDDLSKVKLKFRHHIPEQVIFLISEFYN